jgi:hypothetical protein
MGLEGKFLERERTTKLKRMLSNKTDDWKRSRAQVRWQEWKMCNDSFVIFKNEFDFFSVQKYRMGNNKKTKVSRLVSCQSDIRLLILMKFHRHMG